MIPLRVCLCFCVTDSETERHSLLTQASHYVGCNLSFRGPVRPSDCTEWGSNVGPHRLSCAFTLLTSATLIIARWSGYLGQCGGEVGRVCVCARGGRGARGFGRPQSVELGMQGVMEGFIYGVL